MIFKRAILISIIFLAGHMSSAYSATTTYYFNGICDDCDLSSGTGHIGTLILEDYTEGTEIDFNNFVSFSYIGSNLVFPYVVESSDVGFVGGAIGSVLDASYDFYVDFDDGLVFESSTTGDWYTCASGPGGYYSGTCNFLFNNDFGTGTWSATPGAVPVPAAVWLFGSGLLGLVGFARRKA